MSITVLLFSQGRGIAGLVDTGLMFSQRDGFDVASYGKSDDDEELGTTIFLELFERGEVLLGDASQLIVRASKRFEDFIGGDDIIKEHELDALSPKGSIGFAIGVDFHDGMIRLGWGIRIWTAGCKIDIESFTLQIIF